MSRAFTLLAPFVLVVFGVAACGNTDVMMGTEPDLAPIPDLGSPYPAPFPPPPVVTSAGGPVLANPVVFPIFFANSNATFRPQQIDFEKKLGTTSYWRATTEEYGVGELTVGAPIVLSETATGTLTSQQVESWLKRKLLNDDPAFPSVDENTLFVIHYPAEVTITQPNFFGSGTSCVDFGGYHADFQLDADHGFVDVAYAVIPECSTFGEQMGLDALTGTESHELIEAATDPYPSADPAFSNVDQDHLYWSFALGGGENADLCAQDPASFHRFSELKYVVQRSWSNKAAAAGLDPCVPPLDKAVYFNAAADLTETINLSVGQGQSVTMKGVTIPVGESRTIPIRLYSEADTGADWRVSARDVTVFSGGLSTLAFTWDKTTGRNGDTLNLTVKSTKASQFGATAFMLISKLGTVTHTTFGLVSQ